MNIGLVRYSRPTMGASAARKAARVKRFGKQPPSNATDDRSSTSGTDAAPQTESRSQNPASTDDTSTSLDPDSQDATSPVAAGHSEPSGRKCKEAPRRYICFVGKAVPSYVYRAMRECLSSVDVRRVRGHNASFFEHARRCFHFMNPWLTCEQATCLSQPPPSR